MLKVDRTLVSWQTNREEILHAKKRAYMHRAAGTLAIGGLAAGGAVAVATGVELYKAVIVGSIFFGGPVLGVCTGLLGVGIFAFGLWGGSSLWKKGTQLLEDPKTREALNEIMKNALIAYDQGDHQKFIVELSKEYKSGGSLLSLGSEDYINYKEIIKTLLSHGFRSDGIAYLLNLIGEVLNSGKIIIQGITSAELKAQGSIVLKGVAKSKELEDDARKLDGRIQELRKKSLKRIYYKFSDFFLIHEYSSIAKEHIKDAAEMPFVSRLEEMRNTARINLSISYIVNGGTEEIQRAKEVIEEVRNSINRHHQFIGIAKTRLEVLEDFLWVVSGDELDKLQLCY